MIIQKTLLTCHKGVDLHAASACRVMRRRLAGGERLLALERAEFHTFWQESDASSSGLSVASLREQGRYYNPNKHRFVHAELAPAGPPWHGDGGGHALPAGWPGRAVTDDLPAAAGNVLDRLLGGPPAPGETVVDVVAHPLGGTAPLLSGVVWRLRLDLPPDADAAAATRDLVVARSRRHGLLVNPWMQGWRLAPARTRE